jgi:protoporphyrinogen oxidase
MESFLKIRMFTFDIVIVGAGVAGLYCGIELAKKGKSVCILEKYNYVGGRVVTFHKGELSWENGAGRIADSHTMVHSLLSKYGLKTFPLSDKQLFIESDGTAHINRFESIFEAILKEVNELDAELLRTHTLEQLLKRIYGEAKAVHLLAGFPYRAEVSVLRADLGISAFSKGGEMGSYKGYSVVDGGLSRLTDAMAKEFKKCGGTLKTGYEMIGLSQPHAQMQVSIECRVEKKSADVVYANNVILALHSSALKACPDTRHFPALKHLVMCPLLRTYAVFPLKNGIPWFAGLERCVSAGPVRYFIPVNEKKGIAMVSYTDADNAARLMKIMDDKGEEALGKYIMEELGKMFPDRDIPQYTFFKAHPWTHGCTYWTPGNYDPVILSKEAMHPDKYLPSVYVCGESFSMKQAWMEGALEHAATMLKKWFD